MSEQHEDNRLTALPLTDLLRRVRDNLVFVQPSPAGTEASTNTRLVIDEEKTRVLRIVNEQNEEKLLKELKRFQRTGGSIIFTEGEVSPDSYRSGYSADNIKFGNRTYGLPGESLSRELGPVFDELENRIST